MNEKTQDIGEGNASIVKSEDVNVEETQVAEQLYHSGGLDPIVDAGIKDYDKKLQQENKLINKVLGIRESDIKGYGESVAKRVAFAVYSLLNKQYGGKVGDLRSYILSLEDERNRANTRYDDLMGRVIGILGDEYKELRSDSKEFMEKLTKTLGDDLKASKIDQEKLAERLADIDGLRAQISGLKEEVKDLNTQIVAVNKDKEQLKESYESKMAALNSDHKKEAANLEQKIAGLDTKIAGLEAEKTALTKEHKQVSKDYKGIKAVIKQISETVPGEKLGSQMSEGLYEFLLKDSKVPDMVIDGVGKFINFRKYLGEAVERGAKEVCDRIDKALVAAG